MRLTNILLKQHNGWLQKIKWKIQGKRNILDTGVATNLQKRGIAVRDALDYANYNYYVPPVKLPELSSVEAKSPYENNYSYGDTNVLVYGLQQGQALTNTASFEGFPRDIESRIQSIALPTTIERSMHQSVLISHLLDAEQVKSPYPGKPLFAHKNLFKHRAPKEWGISDQRKNTLLANRLINHCERFYGLGAKHRVLENMQFILPIVIGHKNIQFNIKAEFLMSSVRPINALSTSNMAEPSFMRIDPLDPTISIPQVDAEIATKSNYPITTSTLHPHTILLDFSRSYVKNLYEEPVNDGQFESRALLKAFTVTSSYARKVFGENARDLDQPIVLQTVHLDKNRIQFGIFQLNTLDLKSENKNYWFRKPIMELYEDCAYSDGRPSLVNYNFNVFKTMCVLYGN